MNQIHDYEIEIMILLEKTAYLEILHVDPDKYAYSGYSIRFDSRSEFSLPNGRVGKISLFLQLI